MALQARRPLSHDLARPERQRARRVEEQPVELVELTGPVRRRPLVDVPRVRLAEVPVEVRADLVALAPRARDLPQRSPHHLRRRKPELRPREPDVRDPGRVPRRVIPAPLPFGKQVDPADEEREVRVRPPRDRPPVRPEPDPARAVERDHHELRPPVPHPRVPYDPGRRRRLRDPLARASRLDPADDDEANTADRGQDESDAHAAIVGGGGSGPAQDGSSGRAYWTSIGFGG